METTALLKKVRRIEIKTRGLSNQIFSGNYHSAFKGRGMSFSEVREYSYGDDVRNIDWNVTARFNSPFIKVFEEERELTVMLLIDISRSSYFGSSLKNKEDLITEIAAVLAFSATTNNDKVGVLFFSDKIEKFIPPKKGKSHILRIIRELINIEPTSNGTDLSLAIKHFNNVNKKRSIAFVLSDFLTKDYKNALSIANKRHDIIGLHIYDELEKEMPNVGLLQVKDAESGKLIWIDTSGLAIRKRIRDEFNNHVRDNKAIFLNCGAEFRSVSTTDNYIQILMNLFSQRGAKR